MPGGDRTGPEGAGPRTGRGFGYCSGSDTPGWAQSAGWGGGVGRGWRFGGGGRRRPWRAWGPRAMPPRWGRWAPAPVDEAEMLKSEAERLKTEADQLQGRLDAINRRLDELNQED